jgi:nitroimidazol reductase NimA-like FMN-containing flavoprotein (pyridoxamine 5'-phosphate oxidase superfamily)
MIPTAYARDGRSLYLHGARNNRSLRAVLEGEACISVTQFDGLVLARSILHHSMNYRSVVLFGKGEEVTERTEKLNAMRCFVEHVIPGRWQDARQPSDPK